MTKIDNPTRRVVLAGAGAAGAAMFATRAYAQAVTLPDNVPLFDTHAHLVSADTVKYIPRPISGELRGGKVSPVTPEELIALAKKIGLKRVLAVQLAHTYGFDTDKFSGAPGPYHNSFAADCAAKYPDMIAYTISVNANDPNVADAIRYWVTDRGAAGIRFSAVTQTSDPLEWFASDAAQNAWRAAADLNVPVCIHVFGARRKEVLAALVPLAGKYASTPIVIDHIGNAPIENGAPDYGIDRSFLDLKPFKNVSIKFTTINLAKLERENRFIQPVFRRLVDVFGPERLMWGSDIGNTKVSYEDMARLAREAVAGLTDAQQQQLLYANADAIYGRKWRKS